MNNKLNSILPLTGLAFFFVIPSIGFAQKYFAVRGAVVYALSVSLFILTAYKYVIERLFSAISRKQFLLLTGIGFTLLVFIFVMLYPLVESGTFGGGSDRDNAIGMAAKKLLRGEYPYDDKTYLGNPVTPLPGAILLAVPFSLMGNCGYQNLFWLFIFFIMAGSYMKGTRFALPLIGSMLILSPEILRDIITGGDLFSNAVYILTFSIFMADSVSRPKAGPGKKTLSAILMGIGLSSRLNFVLILPILYSIMSRNAGRKQALKYLTLTILTFSAVTIPFYIYDPGGFSPLEVSVTILSRFREISPVLKFILPLSWGIAALLLSRQNGNKYFPGFFKNCAISQAFPVVSVMLFAMIRSGRIGFDDAGYGLIFLPFGVLASWVTIFGKKAYD